MRKPSFYEKYIKRLLDIIFALTGIIILSPVLIITAILVRIKLGSPVIFTQVRPGKDEKLFKMYKFRTMTDEKDNDGNLLPFEQRITEFGSLLRKISVDELPSLFNILKGDMTIVGPRPLLASYLPYYDECQNRRHEVRPGLTGLAQVSGRNFLDWDERFKLDLQYVDNLNFFNDFHIICKTIVKVFKREDVIEQKHVLQNFDVYVSDKLKPVELSVNHLREHRSEMVNLMKKKTDDSYSKAYEKYDKMFEYLESDLCSIYGYIANDKILGFVQFFEYQSKVFTGIHINRIIINPKFRGHRLGTRLLELIKTKFPSRNLGLEVNKDNIKAIRFYKSNGFVIKNNNSVHNYYMILKR